ncbi:MAG: hypothetical protein V4543_12735 [Bacteroidota bacterium]
MLTYDLKNTLLWLHIIAGTLALVIGAIPIIVPKGKPIHKVAGKVFLYLMFAAAVSGAVLGIVVGNMLLIFIGLFSFYLTYTGYRALKLRRLVPDFRITGLDAVYIPFSMLTGLLMFSLGLIDGTLTYRLNPVMLIFGAFMFLNAGLDIRNYFRWKAGSKIKEQYAEIRCAMMRMHIGRSIGSYIAAMTAFFVVNRVFPQEVYYANWFLPSVLFVPVIIRFSRKFRVRKAVIGK